MTYNRYGTRSMGMELKGVIVSALIGILVISLNEERLAIDTWVFGYKLFLETISMYLQTGIFIFGFAWLFAIFISMWYYTLLTIFIVMFILKLIFN